MMTIMKQSLPIDDASWSQHRIAPSQTGPRSLHAQRVPVFVHCVGVCLRSDWKLEHPSGVCWCGSIHVEPKVISKSFPVQCIRYASCGVEGCPSRNTWNFTRHTYAFTSLLTMARATSLLTGRPAIKRGHGMGGHRDRNTTAKLFSGSSANA